MDEIYVGIDVSKDRLDVAVRPGGEAFVVERNAAGLDRLIARMQELTPSIVALEATGGFETVAAAALAGAELPVVIVNPADTCLCQGARPARKDRPGRCRRDCALCRGDEARDPTFAGSSDAVA